MSKSWKIGLNRAILGKCDKSDQSRRGKCDSIIRKNLKNVKKFKKLKNGLTRAILGKCDKCDQSWTGKRDSKKYF